MRPALLEAKDLYCEREERILFSKLDFSLSTGQLLQIDGANGAGKTTLLKALAGMTRHVEGEVLWRGLSVLDHREEFYSETLVLGHLSGIKLALTPIENLRWMSECRTGIDLDTAALERALDAVELREHAQQICHSLSAGQKRRVALARLFLEPARLWILDEPFSAIDRHGVSALEDVISDHVTRGGCAVVVTHHELRVGPGVDYLRIRLGTDKRGGWERTL